MKQEEIKTNAAKILELVPGLIAVYNIHTGNYIYINDSVTKVLGYSKKEWLSGGLPFVASLVHPDDISQLLQENNTALKKANNNKSKDFKNEPIVAFEYRMKHKNGMWRWLKTDGVIFERNNNGRVEYVMNISIDITERKVNELKENEQRKITQETLKKNEERYRLGLEAGKIGLWEWDIQKNIIIWSDRVYGFYGASPKKFAVTYENFSKHIHPDDQKMTEEAITSAVKGTKDYNITYRIITLQGETRWITSSALVTRDSNGTPLYMLGATTDTTEQKNGENKLKDSQENLVFLSEASKIFSSSLDYKKTLQNVTKLAVKSLAAWCIVDILRDDGIVELISLAHKDPKKVKWAKQYRSLHPVDMNAKTGVPKVLKTGKSEFYPIITDEMLVAGSKNEEELQLARSLEITSAMTVPLCLKDRCIGAITFISTDQHTHYTENDLAIAKELANRSALAIENARLYTESQKAIILRDEFISVASHELKTPVTSLKMYTQVMQKKLVKKGDSESTRPLTKIDEQINKLTMLINDLLNVSKLQHGKLEFNMEEADLNEVVKETVEAIQETDRKHTIIVKGKLTKNVYADRYRIYQVITNLLTNAIKYSPKADKIVVKITAEKQSTVVSVQDFGIGIKKEDQKNIFSQFYRVTNPEEKTFPGLGMGLYIANEIVQRHGGKMNVTSTKGQGSVFSFTLPYKYE